MQQDQYEVLFCDLCGTSVPAGDLDRGAAIRHQGKTIGACCLAVLRQGESPLASLGEAPAAAAPVRAGTGDRHALTVGVAVLAALAAATIFLDQKISRVATTQDEQHGRVSTAMHSDSEVLLKLDMAMDGTARKADVEALIERVTTLDGAAKLHQEQMRLQVDQLRQGLAAVQQDTRQLSTQGIDYRPLFEDLRQQLQRQGAALADLRSSSTAAPASAPAPQAAPPADASPPEAQAPPGLPDALTAQIRKLGDADAAVRFEAVNALLMSKNLAVLPNLLPMVRDPDSFVRRLTIEGLREFKHVDSVDALLAALGDSDIDVRETAWSSLKKLTGQKIAFDAASPNKETRQRGQQRWQEWWEKNKATFGS